MAELVFDADQVVDVDARRVADVQRRLDRAEHLDVGEYPDRLAGVARQGADVELAVVDVDHVDVVRVETGPLHAVQLRYVPQERIAHGGVLGAVDLLVGVQFVAHRVEDRTDGVQAARAELGIVRQVEVRAVAQAHDGGVQGCLQARLVGVVVAADQAVGAEHLAGEALELGGVGAGALQGAEDLQLEAGEVAHGLPAVDGQLGALIADVRGVAHAAGRPDPGFPGALQGFPAQLGEGQVAVVAAVDRVALHHLHAGTAEGVRDIAVLADQRVGHQRFFAGALLQRHQPGQRQHPRALAGFQPGGLLGLVPALVEVDAAVVGECRGTGEDGKDGKAESR